MSLLLGLYVILLVANLLSAIWVPWHIVTVILQIMLFGLLTISIPVHLGWSRRNFVFLVLGYVMSILFGILIFAIIYHRTGLMAGGIIQEVNFADAIYFSVTTWA